MNNINIKIAGANDKFRPNVFIDGKEVKYTKNNNGALELNYATEKDSIEISICKYLEISGKLWFLMSLFFFVISLFGIFDAAGITETRMAVSVNSSKVMTMRVLTLKIIAAEINGIAEERALDMIKDARAGTTGSIPAFYDVIIMKEDRSDGMVDIKIEKIEVMRIVEFKNRRVNRSINHE